MIINPLDNVEVRDDGHKYALRPIKAGENVIKYGMPIGHATADIAAGEHVHVHNVATNLGDCLEYEYRPDSAVSGPTPPFEGDVPKILAYRRRDGRVGIRRRLGELEALHVGRKVVAVGRNVEKLSQHLGVHVEVPDREDGVAARADQTDQRRAHLRLFLRRSGYPYGIPRRHPPPRRRDQDDP